MDTDHNPPPIDSLSRYIQQQLNSGLSPNEIATQLRQAGWPEATITQAFTVVQAQIMPIPAPTSLVSPMTDTSVQSTQQTAYASPPPKRGRFKTSWLLLKQSLRVLKNNKNLTRYVIVSTVLCIVLAIVFAIVFALFHKTLFNTVSTTGTNQSRPTPLGYTVIFIYYVLAFFIANLYSAGLVANVLDVFQGNVKPYKQYMQKARSKGGTLFMFSLLEATVGLVLRAIAERSKLLGRIITAIIGFMWSLARIFVIPIVVSSELGTFAAIKQSTLLLKATWGENLISRVTFGVVMFYVYLLLIPASFILIIIGSVIGGGIGLIIAVFLIILLFLIVGIISQAASSVLNTALFYFASYKQVPAAFDPALLNSVFIRRKKRTLFGRRSTP